jgi:hypothetical protein
VTFVHTHLGPSANAAGEVAFLGGVRDGGVDRTAIFAGAPGALQRIATTGDVSPAGGVYGGFNGRPIIDDAGAVIFTAAPPCCDEDFSYAVLRSQGGTTQLLAIAKLRGRSSGARPLRTYGLGGLDADDVAGVALAGPNWRSLGRIWLPGDGPRPVVRARRTSPFPTISAVAINAQGMLAFAGSNVAGTLGSISIVSDAHGTAVQRRPLSIATTAFANVSVDLNDAGEVVYLDDEPPGSKGVYRWSAGVGSSSVAIQGDSTPAGPIAAFGADVATDDASAVVFVATTGALASETVEALLEVTP